MPPKQRANAKKPKDAPKPEEAAQEEKPPTPRNRCTAKPRAAGSDTRKTGGCCACLCKLIAVAVVVLAIGVAVILQRGGAGKVIVDRGHEHCYRVRAKAGGMGLEDVDLWDDWVVFSSDDRKAYMKDGLPNWDKAPRGDIMAYPLFQEKPELLPVLIEGWPSKYLQPHGISVLNKGADPQLWFINHRPDGEYVSVINLDPEDRLKATFAEDIRIPDVHGINDIQVVGPYEFYVTVDKSYPAGSALGALELALSLPLTRVLHCVRIEGQWDCVTAADGFAMANGIAMNFDGSLIYVTSVLSRELRVFKRIPPRPGRPHPPLELVHTVDTLGTHCDNIHVDRGSGAIHVACHPNTLAFMMYMMSSDPKAISPSQVLRIDPSRDFAPEELMIMNGTHYSAASTAVYHEPTQRYILGSVADSGFLVCHFGPPRPPN